jgi:aminopeptidase N
LAAIAAKSGRTKSIPKKIRMKFFYIFTLLLTAHTALAQRYRDVIVEMKAQAFAEQQAAVRAMGGTATGSLLSPQASTNFDVKHYRCEWEIDPAVKYIKGAVTASFVMTAAGNNITFDLHNVLVVDSVRYRGSNIPFTRGATHSVQINFPASIAAGASEAVTIYYKGVPDASGLGSFATRTHAGVPVLWTLSQPYGARDWWPCKNGLDDKIDSIDVVMTCPAAYRNSTNGIIVSDVVNAGKRTTHFKHRYPIASYLVAIACTNYVVRSYNYNINGKNLLFENWTYPESEGWFAGEEYGVQNALNWFTGFFGEYPFINERYAHTQFSWGGGMEHQTNSFMGAPNHLLMAHELGHQWFGDKTTCGSWKDIWVNEGFASFTHWLYFQNHDLPTYEGIRYEYRQTVTDEPAGSVYVNDTTNIDRIFDWRLSYVKGAFVLHTLRGYLGDAAFFNAMKQYGADSRLKYNFGGIEEARRVFEQSTGKNLQWFFNDWIYGQGYPSYNIKWLRNSNGWLSLQVNQTQSHSSVSFFELPVEVQFKNATRDTIIKVDVQRNGQWFAHKLNFIPDTVIVDPNVWVLSKNNSQQKLNTPNGSDVITVYPNPADRGNDWYFTVHNPSATNYQATLVAANGQTVYQKTYNTTGSDFTETLPASTLAAGIYTLRISNAQTILATKRLVKL